jgi:DNA-binding ferritin-like protein (Dps family)
LREFSSRVDNVENEIKKVREDFSKSIDEIKSVLVDMRATVADVLNPFNILKIYGGGSKKGVPRTSQIIESFEKALESLGRREISQQVGESKREDKEVSRESLESISREIIYRSSSRLGLYGLIKLVKWVDEMIDRVPRDVIEEIAKFMRKTELIDEEEEKIISGVLDFVYKARKLGLRVNDQIIYMYNLAKVFGIDDKKAGEEVLKLAMDNNSLG